MKTRVARYACSRNQARVDYVALISYLYNDATNTSLATACSSAYALQSRACEPYRQPPRGRVPSSARPRLPGYRNWDPHFNAAPAQNTPADVGVNYWCWRRRVQSDLAVPFMHETSLRWLRAGPFRPLRGLFVRRAKIDRPATHPHEHRLLGAFAPEAPEAAAGPPISSPSGSCRPGRCDTKSVATRTAALRRARASPSYYMPHDCGSSERGIAASQLIWNDAEGFTILTHRSLTQCAGHVLGIPHTNQLQRLSILHYRGCTEIHFLRLFIVRDIFKCPYILIHSISTNRCAPLPPWSYPIDRRNCTISLRSCITDAARDR